MNTEDSAPQEADPEAAQAEPELPPYMLEAARSSRSKCRTCKRKIDKDKLRLGILFEGPYGTGFLWHHLTCAAKRRIEDVEAAYELEAWDAGLEVPELSELQKLKEKAAEEKAKRKLAPYLELSPSGRAKCKHCDELIDKDEPRVALLREVVFGQQARAAPVNVHVRCVQAEMRAEDCVTEAEGFEDALRANSTGIDPSEIDRALAEIGEL